MLLSIKDVKKLDRWQLNIKVAGVRSAVTIAVSRRLNFTITILQEKTLVSPKKDIHGVGLKSKKNWISVFCFVPIVIENSMPVAQLPRETAVEKAGELLEALHENEGNQQPSPGDKPGKVQRLCTRCRNVKPTVMI